MNQAIPEAKDAMKREIVVYVRRGSADDSRTLIFARVPEIPADTLLRERLMSDWDMLRYDIMPEWDQHTNRFRFNGYSSLGEALAYKELWLVEFLGKYGYRVDFR
jgi:hypothetical protein